MFVVFPVIVVFAFLLSGTIIFVTHFDVLASLLPPDSDVTPIRITNVKVLPSQEPQLSIPGTCSPGTDPGNISRKNTISIQSSLTGKTAYFTDYCVAGTNKVVEYSCGKDSVATSTTTCPSRCINGACKGIVYVAHTVDTEARSSGNQTDLERTLDFQDFEPGGLIDKVTDPNGWYRTTYKDSFGNPPKYSWFLLADEVYCHSDKQTCTPVHDAMKPFADRIAAEGDLLAYHYHHLGWTTNPGDGLSYWNQLMTMNGQQTEHGTDFQVADRALAAIIINQQTYPSFFRSGWAWENTDFSNWLENVLPFDSSNLSPNYNTNIATQGVIANVYDWSRATQSWNPYHPSATDYQVPGELKRWQFRIANQFSDFRAAFQQADNGQDVLITTVTHNFNYGQGMEYKNDLRNLAILYQGVEFKFVNVLEGARAVLKLTDTTAPTVTVTRQGSSFKVTSNEPLFTYPFAAVKISDIDFRRVPPLVQSATVTSDQYSWVYNFDSVLKFKTADSEPVISFGGTDAAGNTFVTPLYTL